MSSLDWPCNWLLALASILAVAGRVASERRRVTHRLDKNTVGLLRSVHQDTFAPLEQGWAHETESAAFQLQAKPISSGRQVQGLALTLAEGENGLAVDEDSVDA